MLFKSFCLCWNNVQFNGYKIKYILNYETFPKAVGHPNRKFEWRQINPMWQCVVVERNRGSRRVCAEYYKSVNSWQRVNLGINIFCKIMSSQGTPQQVFSGREIPKRVVLNDLSQLPQDYSTTPGGSIFSTTPGGRIIWSYLN